MNRKTCFLFARHLYRLVVFFFLVSSATNLTAQQVIPDPGQYKTTADKLKALKNTCDSLSNIENYRQMKIVAAYALQFVPADDFFNLAMFNHYLGVSMENLTSRDSAIFYHERALGFAEKGKIGKRIRSSHQRLIYLYHSAGNEKKADSSAVVLQKMLDTTTNNIWKYEILAFLGNYYNERAEYEKNIQYILRSIDIQKSLLKEGPGTVDTSDIGISYLNIAKAYIDMKQPEKALEYIAPARPYFIHYASGQTYYHKNYIDAWIQLRQVHKALLHYDSLSVLVTNEAGAFEWNDRLSADLVFADYYLSLNNTDSALLYVNKARSSPDKADAYLLSQINFMTGKVYAARKEYAKAIPLLEGAEEMTRNASLQVHASLLQTLAQSYAAVGNWQQAYTYYEKYAPLRDSLYTEASKKSIADAEARFQNKEKQQQIDTKNLQLSVSRKQKLWLMAGLALLSVLAILLIIIYRNKKRTAALLEEKNTALARLNHDLEEANRTKAKLFSIISHDLRSPISQVYQFLKLQQLNPKLLDEKQKSELSNKIQSATGSLLETMEDLLLWSKTQMNEFKTSFQPVQLSPVIDACTQLLQLNSEAKGIHFNKIIHHNDIAFTDTYFLQTIIRNLLQNAVKASPANEAITIYTEKEEGYISLQIKNQGEPFSQQQFREAISNQENTASINGLGLKLVDELSKKINAELSFITPVEGGTLAIIRLKAG